MEAIVTSRSYAPHSRSGSHSPLLQRKTKVAYLMLPPLVAATRAGSGAQAGCQWAANQPEVPGDPGPRAGVCGRGHAPGLGLQCAPRLLPEWPPGQGTGLGSARASRPKFAATGTAHGRGGTIIMALSGVIHRLNPALATGRPSQVPPALRGRHCRSRRRSGHCASSFSK